MAFQDELERHLCAAMRGRRVETEGASMEAGALPVRVDCDFEGRAEGDRVRIGPAPVKVEEDRRRAIGISFGPKVVSREVFGGTMSERNVVIFLQARHATTEAEAADIERMREAVRTLDGYAGRFASGFTPGAALALVRSRAAEDVQVLEAEIIAATVRDAEDAAVVTYRYELDFIVEE